LNEINNSVKENVNISRRGFLKKASAIIAVISGAVLGIPFLSSLLNPGTKKSGALFSKVGTIDNLPDNKPVNIPLLTTSSDAYLNETELHNIWVIKKNESEIVSYSPICPHLGCSFNWNESTRHFECPCHNSVWDISGKLLGGPSPRNLDTLPVELRGNIFYVKWEKFVIGIPDKVIS
jgi:menaquinol-cytochrome c reductase iron-sulfur subunit